MLQTHHCDKCDKTVQLEEDCFLDCAHCHVYICECVEYKRDKYRDPICDECALKDDGKPKCCKCRINVGEDAFTCQVCHEKKFCESCREACKKDKSKRSHDCIFE